MEFSKEDNLPLAQPIIITLATLTAHVRIPAPAHVGLRYRFVGELVDVEAVLRRARG